MKRSRLILDVVATLIYYCALLAVHYIFARSESWPVISFYLLAFVPYAYWNYQRKLPAKAILVIGLLARVLLLFGFPTLSDDFYRFYWDGALLEAGINPFHFTPADFLAQNPNFSIDPRAFSLMNSPDYYSVYPPTLQAAFFISKVLGGSLFGFVLVSRMLIVLAELGTFWLLTTLLKHFKRPIHLAALYFLNPLIVLELTGNLHNEVFMVSFTLLAYWLFTKNRVLLSAVAIALALAAKLYPLLFVPLFLLRLNTKSVWAYICVFGVVCAALFLPFGGIDELTNVLESLRLYYQSFEFNGGIYAIGRYIGYQLTGYNLIGPWGKALAIVSVLSFVWIYFRKKGERSVKRILTDILLIVFAMYALSTSVMPWYLSMMIGVSAFNSWRFPLVWSALIPMSYAAYGSSDYQEQYGLIALEYLILLGYLIYEYRKYRAVTVSKEP